MGLSFNNNGEEDGTSLVNNGNEVKKKNCPRCGRNNHKLADCVARAHFDGTVLHVMGDTEEIDIDEEVSSETTANFNMSCDNEIEELMFLQPHLHSPEEKQSVCSRNLILKT